MNAGSKESDFVLSPGNTRKKVGGSKVVCNFWQMFLLLIIDGSDKKL